MTEQQQVAMIQTLMHLMGAKDYKPSTSTVLALLREFSSQGSIGGWNTVKNQAPGNPTNNGWDVAKNQAPGTPPTTNGWDVAKNQAKGATSTTSGWDVSKNKAQSANKPHSRQS